MSTMARTLFALFLSVALLQAKSPAAAPPPLTPDMVRNVILTWYAGTNDHKPVNELLALLADDVEMRYPDRATPFTGKAAFQEWYANVLGQFFDETHKIESLEIKVDGQQAIASVIVRWERRWWKSGEARSHYEASLSHQRFELARLPADGRIVIRRKIVETFEKTAPVFQVGE